MSYIKILGKDLARRAKNKEVDLQRAWDDAREPYFRAGDKISLEDAKLFDKLRKDVADNLFLQNLGMNNRINELLIDANLYHLLASD